MALTASGYPYVQPSDALVDFPAISLALAQRLEALLSSTVVAYSASRITGQTYTITAPTAGTYIVEWGAGAAAGGVASASADMTCSAVGGTSHYGSGSDNGTSGGPVVRGGVVLTAGQVVTITVTATAGCTLSHCWARLTRTA